MTDAPLVLIAEDNEKNRKLVRDLLSFRDIPWMEAADGPSAVAMAVEHGPGIVLMDIDLPGYDGVVALGHLREDPRTRDIPVIALTAYAMKGDEERLLAAGFDAYIAKPIDVRSFVDSVLAVAAGKAR